MAPTWKEARSHEINQMVPVWYQDMILVVDAVVAVVAVTVDATVVAS
jgi:hypothetical protein